MRKRIAFVLALAVLNCKINALAYFYEQNSVSDINENKVLNENVSTDSQAKRKPGTTTVSSLNSFGDLIETDSTTSNAMRSEKDIIYNVAFPANTAAYLDPGNLSGKGQIFSKSFQIENYGNTDVAIYIKNINVYYSSEKDIYQLSENEITDAEPRVKKMNINMVWENEHEQIKTVFNLCEGVSNIYVLSLKGARYDKNGEFTELHEGGTGNFYFTGTLNSNPNIEWTENEMLVTFDYEIVVDEESENAGFDDLL